MLWYKTLSLFLIVALSSCLSFQFKHQSRRSIFPVIKGATKTQLRSTVPVISLDKVVIPYWDRRIVSKFGLLVAITWLISLVVKPTVDYEVLPTLLHDAKQQISSIFMKILSTTKDLMRTLRQQVSSLDISSWRQFSLQKIVPINSSFSLYQFSAETKGRIDNIDIGQEVLHVSF